MAERCQWFRQLFGRRLDGELSGSEQQGLEEHLQTCPGCRREHDLEQRIVEGLRTLPVQSCPDAVSHRVQAAVAAASADQQPNSGSGHPSRFRSTGGWSLAALATAALLVMTVLSLRNPPQDGSALVHRSYSYEDVLKARTQARASLVFTAQVIQKTERNAIGETLSRSLATPLKGARDDSDRAATASP